MPDFLNPHPHVAYVDDPATSPNLHKVGRLSVVEATGQFADNLREAGFTNLTELSKSDRKRLLDQAEANRAVLDGGPGEAAFPATDEDSQGAAPASPEATKLTDYDKDALQAACEVRGLSTDGSKDELAERLEEAGVGGGGTTTTESAPAAATGRASGGSKKSSSKAAPNPTTKAAVDKLTYNELRAVASARGLDSSGKKAAIKKRIKAKL